MTRRRKSHQKKVRVKEVILSAIDLIDMDISNMSEIEFRLMIIKLLAGLEKSIKDTRECLRAEIESYQAEIKNALTEMLSKIVALTTRVNEQKRE